MRYYFISTWMTEVEKTDSTKCWQRYGTTRTSNGSIKLPTTFENCLAHFYIIKHTSTLWCRNSTPENVPREMKTYVHKRLVHKCP